MSKELPKTYDHSDVESRLYEKWEKKGYFHAEANPEKKPYCIVMPPPNITGTHDIPPFNYPLKPPIPNQHDHESNTRTDNRNRQGKRTEYVH